MHAGAGHELDAASRFAAAGVDCRSVPRHPDRAGAGSGRRGPGEGRRDRHGGDVAGRAGDENRYGGSAARRVGRRGGCAPEVRHVERRGVRVYGRLAPEGARRRAHGLLSDGEEVVAAEGGHAGQSVLRNLDAHVRRVQVRLAFTKHTLDNGLDVLLHQDRGCPIVAVNLWYHVGSKNEQPGHTGFHHLFEHLMFDGSQQYDRGYFQPLQGAGATLNGSTNADRTNYWEVVPANALELALWMESDRMGYLLPAVTEAKFANQRDVVMNERRQNYENRPYGLAPMALLAALFPPEHPYHWTTIGEVADLNVVTLDQVHAFFRRYYHPGNASIALAGDIDSDRALALVDAHFGEIERGAEVDLVRVSASLPGDVRIRFEDRVELPRLYLTWHTPAMFADGDADLDLASDLLANGKTSRLYRRLVFDERMATDVSAVQNSREVAGFVQLVATAAPGHTLSEIERAILEEIARLGADGPTDEEIERGRVQAEAQFMFR